MKKHQRKLVVNFIVVITFTTAMVIGFSNLKNLINRSEALRSMEILGKEVLAYRQTYGSLPNESFAKQIIEQIGAVRLTGFQYRAPWIEYNCDPNITILAYSETPSAGLVQHGTVVLWLNGKTEWISQKDFNKIIESQQKQQELNWLKEHLQKGREQ
jgi:hypothetical protein